MKKLFSLCLTTLLFMSMFVVNASAKTVLTVEKKWAVAAPGASVARQGMGMDGALYYHKAGDGVYKVTSATDPATLVVSSETSGIGAHAIAKDDAGNIVLFGSASFPSSATTPLFIYILKKGETTGTKIDAPALDGYVRADFIAASGDVFGEDGGHLYILLNSGAAAYDVLIKNGQVSATKFAGMTMAAQQNCVMLKEGDKYYYASASQGIYEYDGTTATLLTGLKDLNVQCVGATKFTLAGKEIYVYHTATNYSPEFVVYNKTDDELVKDKDGNTIFFPNDKTKIASGGTLRGVWANAEKVDDNNYNLYIWHAADGGAVYTVSAVQSEEITLSCNEEQGTVTGGGEIAVGTNATVVATPKPGYEFVAWKKGEETVSTDASYTFEVKESVTLVAVFEAKENVTLTLAVNDAALGSITLPEGIVLGENSVVYGTPVELTAVPAEGKTFAGWYKGEELYSTDYTITLKNKESISLVAKFVGVLKIAYELNGGVTNDSNWISKGQLMLEIQNDYNAKYSGALAVVKEENGVYYFKIGEEWKPEAEAQGQDALVAGFFQNKTWSADQKCANLFLNNEKYQFLVDLIDHFASSALEARGTDKLSEMAIGTADAYFRADVSGFMLNSPATEGYPYTCNWVANGLPDAYNPVWKHAFANPEVIVTEVTLNAPYKEGFTFDGWYAEADFSGEKITKVGPESKIEGGKLYAKWVEYIPTLAEVIGLAENVETKAKGVVTYINNKNAYIQDASAGMLLFCKAAPTFKVGDQVVVKGTRTVYGGAPELKDVEEVSAEPGIMPKAVGLASLAAAKAEPLKYFGQLVSFKGLTIVAYDNYSNPSVADAADTVACYKMSLDQTAFPIGTKVNVTAIAGYYNAFQLVGDIAGIVEADGAGKDNYEYPARGENGEYTIENKWIISNTLDNFAPNRPAGANFCRGMAAQDGKMYFIDRGNASITVVNGANGKMLAPIKITGDHLFEKFDEEKQEWASDVTLAYNDIKFDNAGNCLITACSGNDQGAYVYIVDLATGAATELINEHIRANEDFAEDIWRMDAIGVYGDVKSKAVIMFGNSMNKSAHTAYKWDIVNGVAGDAERIDLVVKTTDDTYLWKNEDKTELTVEDNSACQVFPVDFNYFYWDHHSCRPTLFNMDGLFVDDLKACPTGTKVFNNPNDSCFVGSGHNGICEFQIGPDYFVIMAATNTAEVPASSFAIFKFADESKDFAGLTPMWFLPAKGMGNATNAYRTAVPTVEVKGNKATIYLYTGENGYAVYEMTGVEGPKVVEKLYVTGNIEGNSWNAENPVEMTAKGNQVFEANLTFTDATSYFALSEAKGSWDAFNAERYGANPNKALVAIGAPVDLVAAPGNGDACITVAAGTYKVTADMVAMKLSVEEVTAVENVFDATTTTKRIEDGNLIIIRNGVRYNAQGIRQ